MPKPSTRFQRVTGRTIGQVESRSLDTINRDLERLPPDTTREAVLARFPDGLPEGYTVAREGDGAPWRVRKPTVREKRVERFQEQARQVFEGGRIQAHEPDQPQEQGPVFYRKGDEARQPLDVRGANAALRQADPQTLDEAKAVLELPAGYTVNRKGPGRYVVLELESAKRARARAETESKIRGVGFQVYGFVNLDAHVVSGRRGDATAYAVLGNPQTTEELREALGHKNAAALMRQDWMQVVDRNIETVELLVVDGEHLCAWRWKSGAAEVPVTKRIEELGLQADQPAFEAETSSELSTTLKTVAPDLLERLDRYKHHDSGSSSDGACIRIEAIGPWYVGFGLRNMVVADPDKSWLNCELTPYDVEKPPVAKACPSEGCVYEAARMQCEERHTEYLAVLETLKGKAIPGDKIVPAFQGVCNVAVVEAWSGLVLDSGVRKAVTVSMTCTKRGKVKVTMSEKSDRAAPRMVVILVHDNHAWPVVRMSVARRFRVQGDKVVPLRTVPESVLPEPPRAIAPPRGASILHGRLETAEELLAVKAPGRYLCPSFEHLMAMIHRLRELGHQVLEVHHKGERVTGFTWWIQYAVGDDRKERARVTVTLPERSDEVFEDALQLKGAENGYLYEELNTRLLKAVCPPRAYSEWCEAAGAMLFNVVDAAQPVPAARIELVDEIPDRFYALDIRRFYTSILREPLPVMVLSTFCLPTLVQPDAEILEDTAYIVDVPLEHLDTPHGKLFWRGKVSRKMGWQLKRWRDKTGETATPVVELCPKETLVLRARRHVDAVLTSDGLTDGQKKHMVNAAIGTSGRKASKVTKGFLCTVPRQAYAARDHAKDGGHVVKVGHAAKGKRAEMPKLGQLMLEDLLSGDKTQVDKRWTLMAFHKSVPANNGWTLVQDAVYCMAQTLLAEKAFDLQAYGVLGVNVDELYVRDLPLDMGGAAEADEDDDDDCTEPGDEFIADPDMLTRTPWIAVPVQPPPATPTMEPVTEPDDPHPSVRDIGSFKPPTRRAATPHGIWPTKRQQLLSKSYTMDPTATRLYQMAAPAPSPVQRLTFTADEEKAGIDLSAHHRIAIVSDLPGSGKTWTALKNLKPEESVVVAPTHMLLKGHRKAGWRTYTATKWFGQRVFDQKVRRPGYKIEGLKAVMIDEIYMMPLPVLEVLKRDIEEHPEIRFIATGDPRQNKPIDDAHNDALYEDAVRQLFPVQCLLLVMKRLPKQQHAKLLAMKDHIDSGQTLDPVTFAKKFGIPTCTVANIDTAKEIVVAASNAYACHAVNRRDKDAAQTGGRWVFKGDTKRFSSFIMNETYEITDVDESGQVTFAAEDDVEVTFRSMEEVRRNFRIEGGYTSHALQGSTIEKDIVLAWSADWPNNDRLVWTAITRCKDLDQLRIAIDHAEVSGGFHKHFDAMAKRLNQQDKDAGRPGRGVTASEIHELFKRHGFRCLACGCTDIALLELDRIDDQAAHDPSQTDLRPACRGCNAPFGALQKKS